MIEEAGSDQLVRDGEDSLVERLFVRAAKSCLVFCLRCRHECDYFAWQPLMSSP